MNTLVSVLGQGEPPPMDVAEHSEGSDVLQDERRRADALCTALVADVKVVKEHAQW